jgi:hypothetical protein
VKFGVRALIISALLGGCVAAPPRELPPYREVVNAADSARPTADRILSLLAAGDIDAAAALSNAPEQRAELLRAYRERVGETEFRRAFADYASHRAVREIAIGDRRLLIWDLGRQRSAQYFVRSGNGFVLDDVPSAERDELRRVLAAYRDGRVKPSAGTD